MPIPAVQPSHPEPHHSTPPISSFTPHQLHAHLAHLHITPADAQLLLHEDVDGQSALALTHDNLQLLGVKTFGRRQRILDAVTGGRVGKPGDGSREEKTGKRDVAGEDRGDGRERQVEHEKHEGGLLSHMHWPRPHSAAHPTQSASHPQPPPNHAAHPRPHSAQPNHTQPLHPHQPPGTTRISHNNPPHTTAANGALVYPSDFSQYSSSYSTIPSLPITPYQPPLAYAPNLAYPPAYTLQPYQHEEKQGTQQPPSRAGRREVDEDGWDEDGSDDDYIRGEPKNAKVRAGGRVESEDEIRRRRREERAEAELRWEEEKEDRRIEKEEVMRLNQELQRREQERERIQHKPTKAGRKQLEREQEEADEEAERLTPSPTRPFPARPSSAAAARLRNRPTTTIPSTSDSTHPHFVPSSRTRLQLLVVHTQQRVPQHQPFAGVSGQQTVHTAVA